MLNYDVVISELMKLNLDKYLIVDVGCSDGELAQRMKHKFPAKYIGIDPTPAGEGYTLYDEFYQFAIDDVPSKEMKTFYTYQNSAGCNSLLQMNKDIITHDLSEYDNKWYVESNIEAVENCITVPAISLKELLSSSNSFLETQAIHFLKVDAQGMDIQVVKSLKDIIKKTYMIQIESVVAPNPDVVLYQGQQSFEKDLEYMTSIGFNMWHMVDYSVNKNMSPEADIIFINRGMATL